MPSVLITTTYGSAGGRGSSVSTAVASFDTESDADECVQHIVKNPTLETCGPYTTVFRKAERIN